MEFMYKKDEVRHDPNGCISVMRNLRNSLHDEHPKDDPLAVHMRITDGYKRWAEVKEEITRLIRGERND
jgi:hypothetical protein